MLFELSDDDNWFPDPSLAEQDGLLAYGGRLSEARLISAYRNGIFPWYSDETPVLWFSPHERFVLYPEELVVSKSMNRVLNQSIFNFTSDQKFSDVIAACATTARKDQPGTWITSAMEAAYLNLHKNGFAHSIETWRGDKLVGGLYGVLMGKVFCGESMFSKEPNASKAALIWLIRNFDLDLIDCQIYSAHLESLGARMISREEYMKMFSHCRMENNI